MAIPIAYRSLEQHAGELTHVCPEWFALANGLGDLQIDADIRLPKLAAAKGIALMPLLTNLVGDTWQPEAVENLAHGPPERQEHFIAVLLSHSEDAKAAGVVIDWEQVDPAYEADITQLLNRIAEAPALRRATALALRPAGPGPRLHRFRERLGERRSLRRAALRRDFRSSMRPVRSARGDGSKSWLKRCSWTPIPSNGSSRSAVTVTIGRTAQHRAELISFPEAMSRASNAGVESGVRRAARPQCGFLLRGCGQGTLGLVPRRRHFPEPTARGARSERRAVFALYRLGTEDAAIWDALNRPAQIQPDESVKQSARSRSRGTDTITDVGEGEIVTVDETRTDGARMISRSSRRLSDRDLSRNSRNSQRSITRARAASMRSRSLSMTGPIRNGRRRSSTS